MDRIEPVRGPEDRPAGTGDTTTDSSHLTPAAAEVPAHHLVRPGGDLHYDHAHGDLERHAGPGPADDDHHDHDAAADALIARSDQSKPCGVPSERSGRRFRSPR